MKYFTQLLGKAMRDQRGATAIEYGLIAALICIAIVASISSVGSSISDVWMFFSVVANTAMGN